MFQRGQRVRVRVDGLPDFGRPLLRISSAQSEVGAGTRGLAAAAGEFAPLHLGDHLLGQVSRCVVGESRNKTGRRLESGARRPR